MDVSDSPPIQLREARPSDVVLILEFIQALADYEKEPDAVHATEAQLKEHLFGEKPVAYCLIGFLGDEPAGFALYFFNFSTWLGKPGLYLEDLFVKPEFRKHGLGGALLRALAQIAVEKDCGRMEWSALDWNRLAIDFYLNLGAVAMDEWTQYRLTEEGIRRLAEATPGKA